MKDVKDIHIGVGRSTVGDLDSPFLGWIDEFGIWNRTLTDTEISDIYNGGLGLGLDPPTPIFELAVTLDSLPNSTTNLSNTNFTFNATLVPTNTNLTNATLRIWNASNTLITEVTNTIVGNVTNISTWNEVIGDTGPHNWTVFGCSENLTDTICSFPASNRTFNTTLIIENSQTFNATSLDGATESFIINVTANSSLTSGEVVYAGVPHSSTQNGEIFTSTFTVTGTGTQTFFWNFTHGNQAAASLNNTQLLNQTLFGPCNATLTVPYINFTFKNETTAEEFVNATITSAFNFWVGDAVIINNLTFSNASENANYAFCATPSDTTINVNYTINYNNGDSQQRTSSANAILTNTTTNIVLFLLPTSEGLFSPFQTVISTGSALEGVVGTITRILGGSTITVASGITDSSGFITYFLDPDITYTGTFTKLTFADNVFTFVPTTTTRTVTMGGATGITSVGNGTEILQNTSYSITPTNSNLIKSENP